MNIEDITLKQAREIAAFLNLGAAVAPASNDSHWNIGQPYFIRTVTMALYGKLKAVTPQELVLEPGAAWIADTGRFQQALEKGGSFSEVEMFPSTNPVIIGRGSLVDAIQIDERKLSQK